MKEGIVAPVVTGYFNQSPYDTYNHADGLWIKAKDHSLQLGTRIGVDKIQGGNFFSPWSNGTFIWNIPLWYKIGDSASATVYSMGTIEHEVTINDIGTVTIEKGGIQESAGIFDETDYPFPYNNNNH